MACELAWVVETNQGNVYHQLLHMSHIMGTRCSQHAPAVETICILFNSETQQVVYMYGLQMKTANVSPYETG